MTQVSAGPLDANVGARWSSIRRLAGYGAATSMSLYLAVKVIWVVVGLFGHGPDDFGKAGWVLLNAVTVVMAATGVALGLALAQPWGRRLRAAPVIFFSWIGAGFLVPMLPYMVATIVLGALGVDLDGGADSGGDGGDGSGSTPGWEMVFLGLGFAGMAVGLAVALPIYLRERWPRAFVGRVGNGPGPSSPPGTAGVVAATALGLLWSYWALGGTVGFDPGHRDHWDLNGQLLNASSGLCALAGAWSAWTLTRGRPARLRRWVPMTVAFGTSGSLFAWSAWKLAMVVFRPGGFVPAEYAVVAVVEHAVGIGAGAALLTVVIRAVSARAADR